jgi:hypothetical protein
MCKRKSTGIEVSATSTPDLAASRRHFLVRCHAGGGRFDRCYFIADARVG